MESATCQRIDLRKYLTTLDNNQYAEIIKSLCFPYFANIVTLILRKVYKI